MKAIALVFVGMVLGGLFVNAKYDTPKASEEQVVLGTRIGSLGQEILVVKN
ncbi:hypothetical protein AVT69_gp110 [Pseudomonas phage PhiPA3]|uniref:Uncharacterized protein 111 n=1 Tax=Pseudomonas phage PhiPA3 TaxID=998086 RepID=F8SJY7_BPPA3|nr:hypothetical protein AVT69_gp110 [Pseudomonas phage PhiPA3]AEH03535.1 hypothetical protein [Pseudomonas phage PhiPA3]